MNSPAHPAVFCVDEKTAIQALDREDPVLLPLSPGRAERHGFESRRHGTLSLYAAFDTGTGEVLGKTAARTRPRSSWRSSLTWWLISRTDRRSTSLRTTLCAQDGQGRPAP